MGDHRGRACLVIGGSSGIGRGACLALAQAGAMVAVHGLNEGDADKTVDAIVHAGGRAIALSGPVQDSVTSRAAVEATIGEFGHLDTLVVSSGIQSYGDVVQTAEADWDDVFDVNVKGVYLAAQSALPALRRVAGSIVIVASVQGSASQPLAAAYVASKGAVLALVRSMAVDEGVHGVRVNSVSPGSIDTPMLRAAAERLGAETHSTTDELLASWGTAHALGRLGHSNEVGDAIAYLAGPRSGFISGIDLRVDGGMLARLPLPRTEKRMR